MGTLWNGQGCSWSSIAIPPVPNSFVLVPEGNFSSMELLFLSVPKGQILSLSFCSHRFPSAKAQSLLLSLHTLQSTRFFSFMTSLTVVTPRSMYHIWISNTTQLCSHHRLPFITLQQFSKYRYSSVKLVLSNGGVKTWSFTPSLLQATLSVGFSR